MAAAASQRHHNGMKEMTALLLVSADQPISMAISKAKAWRQYGAMCGVTY